MEKNELSRIPDPDPDEVVSPDNPDDPNDPVVTTDDPNDPATDGARRRNIVMEKNEQSRIADPDGPDIVVSPDDPNDPVVTTDDPNTYALVTNTLKEIRSTCAFVTITLKEIRAEQEKVKFIGRNNNDHLESSSSKQEKHQPKDTKIEIEDNPDDPNDTVVSTDYVEKKKERNMFAWLSQMAFPQQLNDTKIVIEELEKIFGAKALKNIHDRQLKQCCIMVPRDLRTIDRKAYTPQVISIGPFYHGKSWLSEMENQKLRYMLKFSTRPEGPEKVKKFKKFIEEKEQTIRNYYQENSILRSPEFVKMILRDAVFIIEFFLQNAELENERKFDFFLDTPYVRAAITRDLQLLENQLPYFLLKTLFVQGAFLDFTKKDYPRHDPFLILSIRFFFKKVYTPKDREFPEPKNKIQHFTDLIRYFLLMGFLQQDQKQKEHVRHLPTATKLHGSGVKFKKHKIAGGSPFEISCKHVPRAMRIKGCEIRIPCIKKLELQIPSFEIDDWSECQYRNLMALELCLYPEETHICNFILLMNFLINTEKDVDLLVDEGIILSRLGDNATVATMFNNLGLQITPSPSVYHDICEKLKVHYDKNWNRTMANLKTVYFRDIWKGTATGAAIILLVLTSVQTIFSILSLFK